MQIKDWWVARELDVCAAELVQKELMDREIAREKRDREFWVTMFGGEVDRESEYATDGPDQPETAPTLPESDDELIARSMLARR
jgi:hypothetical protein